MAKITSRQIAVMGIGAALFGVLATITAPIGIGTWGAQLRPAVAIPISIGILFGPLPGFVVGAIGNVICDAVALGRVSICGPVGSGLMGLVAGLMGFRKKENMLYVILAGLIGGFACGPGAAYVAVLEMGAPWEVANMLALTIGIPDAILGAILAPPIVKAYLAQVPATS